MPKNTFFNLSEEKKELIIEATINEFSNYNYHKASINRIVDSTGIAKGSFYQYFEDKDDLFRYVIEIAINRKAKYLEHIAVDANELKFFELLQELYMGALRFAKDNPKLSQIFDDFMKNTDKRLKEIVLGEGIQKSNEFIKKLLIRGIKTKEIRPDIDLKFISFLMTSMSVSLGDYYRNNCNELVEEDYRVLVDQMINLLQDGVKYCD